VTLKQLLEALQSIEREHPEMMDEDAYVSLRSGDRDSTSQLIFTCEVYTRPNGSKVVIIE